MGALFGVTDDVLPAFALLSKDLLNVNQRCPHLMALLPASSTNKLSRLPLTFVDMAVLLKATDIRHLEGHWHAKFDAIRRLYATEPSAALKTEYVRVPKQFADLVVSGERPRVHGCAKDNPRNSSNRRSGAELPV